MIEVQPLRQPWRQPNPLLAAFIAACMLCGTAVLQALLSAPLPAQVAASEAQAPQQDTARPQVLFLTHSAGFAHEVVKRPATGLAIAETELSAFAAPAFRVRCTQDCGEINAAALRDVRVVVFYTTGELPISEANRAALLAFVREGGGFVGIHCATDTFYEWNEFGQFIGGRFDGHPWHQEVGVLVEDAAHPANAGLGAAFRIHDEIYQHRELTRSKLSVLLRLDPKSVDIARGRHADGEHPLSWCSAYGKGRVFYTALGHRPEVWKDERFRRHVLEGLRWAAGLEQPQPAPPNATQLLIEAALPGVALPGGGDGTLHLEFEAPDAAALGQVRLGAGATIHLSGRVDAAPLADSCGAIVGVAAPSVLAQRAGWQTLDVVTRRDSAGLRRITIALNGTPVHTYVALPAPAQEMRLQCSGTSLRFRNIWFVARTT